MAFKRRRRSSVPSMPADAADRAPVQFESWGRRSSVPSMPADAADRAPVQFESWGSFCDRAENGVPQGNLGYRDSRSASSWTGTATFEDAVNLARNGWAEGTERAARLTYPLVDKLAAQLMREEFTFATTGVTFDVARVLESEPECWIECEQQQVDAPGRILHLTFNCAVSASISTEAIIAKGAVVAALVMILERGGFRVQVDVVCALDGYNDSSIKHETWIPVKAASQDVDLPRLIFALAHPSMLRRMWFSLAETFSPALRRGMDIPGGYGIPRECAADRRGDIYIGRSFYGEPQWENEASATAWIISELKKQGVQIAEEK